MILAIVGSVEEAWEGVMRFVAMGAIEASIAIYKPHLIISGESPKGGVDQWAKASAQRRKIDFKGYPPLGYTWQDFAERNLQMAKDCDTLVAIRSRTAHTYGSGWTADRAEELGKEVHRILI